jgi:hypothetical protein
MKMQDTNTGPRTNARQAAQSQSRFHQSTKYKWTGSTGHWEEEDRIEGIEVSDDRSHSGLAKGRGPRTERRGTNWKINVAIDWFEEGSKECTCGMGTVGIAHNE